MKRFTPDAVKNRMMANLRVKEDWAMLVNNGTASNLLDVMAEDKNETARYMEYLYLEKFWNTAQNYSSLQAQGKLIGYKRRLPISAIGTVIVSHSDEQGNNRLENIGSLFFDIDTKSDYDDKERNLNASSLEKAALVPWVSDNQYLIPKGTVFKSNNGIEYISTKSVSSRPLSDKWSNIQSSQSSYRNFIKNGGWNNIKYLKIPVIQGKRNSITLGLCDGTRFQTFVYEGTDVEDASNAISREYFSITINSQGSTEIWTEINNLDLAGKYDKVFEKKILDDESGIQIKFGDGITGKIPPEGSMVTMNYLETLGSGGNLSQKYQITSIIPESPIMDPRTNTYHNFLSCTNIYPIIGGKDIEDISEYKLSAPKSYQKNYTISGLDGYKTFFDQYSPISFLQYKIYNDDSIKTRTVNSFGTSIIKSNSELTATRNSNGNNVIDHIKDEITSIYNDIHITGILSDGTILEEADSEEALIKPLEYALGNRMNPSDRFVYTKPNVVKLKTSVIVNSVDLETPEAEIKQIIKDSINSEYDIFNQVFKEPLYLSKEIELAKNKSFSDSVKIINEAKANIDISPESIQIVNTSGYSRFDAEKNFTLLAIPFSFDPIFIENKYYQGFKDCTVNSDYLIKVNLKFKNMGGSTSNSRTFFLIDNRIDESYNVTLDAGKQITAKGENYSKKGTFIIDSVTYNLFDEENDNYADRQVRVMQFPYINGITNNTRMTSLRDFSVSPSEIRPLVQGTDGKTALFKIEDVESDLRYAPSQVSCKKKNLDYIPCADIIFNENYSKVENVMTGYFVMPLSYFKFPRYSSDMLGEADIDYDMRETISNYLKQYVDLEILAEPKQEDFFPINDNDIICIDDIIVEKKIMTNG